MSADGKSISRRFDFKIFIKPWLLSCHCLDTNLENHHPDMEVGYNYCAVKIMTHAIQGLSKNDFICAAKIDALGAEQIMIENRNSQGNCN